MASADDTVAHRQPNSAATSCVIRSSNFDPALTKRGVRSGRYLLPKRKLPSKLVSTARRKDQPPFQRRVYVEPGPCNVKFKEIIESRPPLRLDLSTPGPWAYSPENTKPLNETNAPAYTMRPRCWSERDVGGRTAWSKTWYQSPEVWTSKVNFNSENVWPTPSTYDEKLKIGGNHQATRARYPAYSMGQKTNVSLIRVGTDKEPSPASYSKSTADGIIYNRAPTIIHALRPRNSNLWGYQEVTPGPAAYNPNVSAIKRHQPSFSLSRSSREGLEPLLGPFSSS